MSKKKTRKREVKSLAKLQRSLARIDAAVEAAARAKLAGAGGRVLGKSAAAPARLPAWQAEALREQAALHAYAERMLATSTVPAMKAEAARVLSELDGADADALLIKSRRSSR